jgi:RNA-directed DNA polymerase
VPLRTARTALFSLHRVIDLDWMKEAYRLTRKNGAPGVDGVTAADYEANLEVNLLDLLERIKSGRNAPAARRRARRSLATCWRTADRWTA